MGNMDRRTFVKGGTLVASAAAIASITGCAPTQQPLSESGKNESPLSLPNGIIEADFEESVVERDKITEFAIEETYDIVVVGAGCAGVPAVVTALEEGATVACLQKEAVVAANGFGSSGVIPSESDEAAMKRYMSAWAAENGDRLNRMLFQYWMDHSEDTLCFLSLKGEEAGLPPVAYDTEKTLIYEDGTRLAAMSIVTSGNNEFMTNLAAWAEKDGAKFYYATPCVQLVQDEEGAVTGAIGKAEDGSYVKLNATKGVILAAGDYQNNRSLLSRYCNDAMLFKPDQMNRTGDGHILGSLAGGSIVAAGHPRQIHCLFTTSHQYLATPLLMLNPEGKRFMNEEARMTSWNTIIRYAYENQPFVEDAYPIIYRFFDCKVDEKYPGQGNLGAIEQSMNGGNSFESIDGVIYRADTLEELCDLLEIDSQAFIESIDHYNELCATGQDADFGKLPENMQPIDTPPFYGVRNSLNFAAVNGGLKVDGHYQVVNANGEPIPRLFAAGTNGGDICGGINWTMPPGCSNGHCFTAGRYSVIYALTGGLEPSHRYTYKDLGDKLLNANGKYTWDDPATAMTDIVIW